jgi:hypothetical protein
MQPTSRRSVTHAAIAQHAKRLLGETSALYRYHSGTETNRDTAPDREAAP